LSVEKHFVLFGRGFLRKGLVLLLAVVILPEEVGGRGVQVLKKGVRLVVMGLPIII